MDNFYDKLNTLFTYDPGNRGLPALMPPADLAGIFSELKKAERVLIVSGFPILPTGIGETDGPPGAVNIAAAIKAAGKKAALLSDAASYEILKAGAEFAQINCPIFNIKGDSAEADCTEALEIFNPTHIIAIERPGKINGHFRNMRGMVIDEFVADTDCLFDIFKGVTLAIGDGGNELGMGSLRAYAKEAEYWADKAADFPMVAGVSNWWSWGLAALISISIGKNILPTPEEEEGLLRACVSAGAIDGVSKEQAATVDGISLEDNIAVLLKIHELVDEYL